MWIFWLLLVECTICVVSLCVCLFRVAVRVLESNVAEYSISAGIILFFWVLAWVKVRLGWAGKFWVVRGGMHSVLFVCVGWLVVVVVGLFV